MSDVPSFDEFYEAVHGRCPFPWQATLADRVAADGWPELIDVPTGMGKTSVLDIAVYELARQVGSPNRTAATRTALIVDRRLVVDGAFGHASRLADALAAPGDDEVLGAVASRLMQLVVPSPIGNRPLEVVRMRGGVTWAARWLRSPAQPAVIVGTVDQFGSRLLFRGYGTSDRMKPVDAALVGTDMLCLLDEAHLSVALAETVAECQLHEDRAPGRAGRPLAVVKMSATLAPADSVVAHGVTDDDLDSPAADRLTAVKYTTLVEFGAKLSKAPGAALAGLARGLLADQKGGAIGVVTNTVGAARQVFAELQKARIPSALAIGRCRPLDRERSMEEWWPRTRVGRDRSLETGFVLVATQTIEVGVDLDLDGLVTQCASLDAIVQRFGRVDRLGSVGQTRSVIVRVDDDPVYGDAAERSWVALRRGCEPVVVDDLGAIAALNAAEADSIDMGPLAAREWASRLDDPAGLIAELAPSPLPTAATLSWWRRTAPIPDPDEDVSAYLHGVGRWSPTVSVVWRSGIDASEGAEAEVASLMAAFPPLPDETVEVSIGALRGLLSGTVVDSTDVDGVELGAVRRSSEESSSAWAWRGDRWQRTDASSVRPGDIVIVPSSLGGHDRWGWTGIRETAGPPGVVDVGGLGGGQADGLRLRLVAEVLEPLLSELGSSAVLAAVAEANDVKAVVEALRRACVAASEVDPAGYAPLLLRRLENCIDRGAALITIERAGHVEDSAPITERVDLVLGGVASRFGEINDDADSSTSAVIGREVGLGDHLRSVGERAGATAGRLGLADDLVSACRLAGRFHDLGKAEVRFQTLLRHGRRHVAEAFSDDAETALAKSRRMNGAAERSVAGRSGWPLGMRHEAISLLLAQSAPDDVFAAVDRHLVEHLVASHHGHARPFFPAVPDHAPTSVEVRFDGMTFVADSAAAHPALEHAAQFERLNERYGTWGLAALEAIVRLSDMMISEEGS